MGGTRIGSKGVGKQYEGGGGGVKRGASMVRYAELLMLLGGARALLMPHGMLDGSRTGVSCLRTSSTTLYHARRWTSSPRGPLRPLRCRGTSIRCKESGREEQASDREKNPLAPFDDAVFTGEMYKSGDGTKVLERSDGTKTGCKLSRFSARVSTALT
eukprot:327772-Hanusia_phi.AAC.6